MYSFLLESLSIDYLENKRIILRTAEVIFKIKNNESKKKKIRSNTEIGKKDLDRILAKKMRDKSECYGIFINLFKSILIKPLIFTSFLYFIK